MNKYLLLFSIVCTSCEFKKVPPLGIIHATKVDTILAGSSRTLYFKLVNNTNEKIILQDYTVSCECTSSGLHEGTKINSLDTLDIWFTINTTLKDKQKLKQVDCILKSNTIPQLTTIPILVYIK